VALVLGPPGPARADLWDDMVNTTVTPGQVQTWERAGQGEFRYSAPSLSLSTGQRGGTIASTNLSTRRGCGVADFASEFSALFNAEALQSYIKGLGQNVLQAAPLVMLCYASPTLCDAYKHFRTMASGMLQAKAAECQAVEHAALGAGEQMRKRQELACIEDKVAAGTPMYQALDQCKGADIKLVGYDLSPVDDLDLVGGALDKVGADQDTRDLAKVLLGDVTLRAGGAGAGRQITRPAPDALNRVWTDTQQGYVRAIETALASLEAGRTPTIEALRAISAPGRPVTAAELAAFLRLDPASRAIAVQRLASALALARLSERLGRLKEDLAESRRLAQNTNQAQHEIDNQIAATASMIARLRRLKEDQDLINQALGTTAQEAARQQEEARRRTAPDSHARPAVPRERAGRFELGGGVLFTPR
jgi:hypothetical protein